MSAGAPRRARASSLQPKAEMNLTSMMDLTFLLLITFIITFPLIEQGLPVNLPKDKARALDTREHSVSVTVNAAGDVFFDQDPVPVDPESLERRLTAAISADPETFVFVRGDEAVPYGKLVEVLKLVNRLGITRMTLVTQEG